MVHPISSMVNPHTALAAKLDKEKQGVHAQGGWVGGWICGDGWVGGWMCENGWIGGWVDVWEWVDLVGLGMDGLVGRLAGG